jgi:hypothetical protein
MAFAHGHGCYGGTLLGASCNGEECPTGQGYPQAAARRQFWLAVYGITVMLITPPLFHLQPLEF